MCARAVCVISGCAGSESLSGCAGVVACECGAPCVSASVAVERPWWALGLLVRSVCAVVGAARAAAVRRKAGGEAVLGVPVGPRADGCVVSASVNRRARAAGNVARMPEKVRF